MTYLQRVYLAVSIVLMPVATAAVVLRFVAVSRSPIKHQAEDWLALTSLVFYLVFCSLVFAGM